VVERRKASALRFQREPRPYGAEDGLMRLPAFRFLFYLGHCER
jgi:hypothetical protein